MSLKHIAEMKQLREDLYKAMEEIAKLKSRVHQLESQDEPKRKIGLKDLRPQ